MLRTPKPLESKPSILEYIGTGINNQITKRTVNKIAKPTCNFCLLFIAMFFILFVTLWAGYGKGSAFIFLPFRLSRQAYRGGGTFRDGELPCPQVTLIVPGTLDESCG